MATRLQLRKGTTTEHSTFIGADGEVTVDTTKKTLVLHDGKTAGGVTIANRQDIDEHLLNYLPTPYPKSTPPAGYLALMGQSISQATYPILYSLYGAKLPDLRGLFIRGLGGNSDQIGVVQGDAIRNITGTYQSYFNTQASEKTGAFYNAGSTHGGSGGNVENKALGFDASRVVPTANENRPINIAFLYIVKAG